MHSFLLQWSLQNHNPKAHINVLSSPELTDNITDMQAEIPSWPDWLDVDVELDLFSLMVTEHTVLNFYILYTFIDSCQPMENHQILQKSVLTNKPTLKLSQIY